MNSKSAEDGAVRNCSDYIARDARLVRLLRIADIAAVAVTVLAFLFGLGIILIVFPLGAVNYLAVLFIPFLVVTILRRWINAPRPESALGKSGGAFPSRHAFSAFAIGTLLCFISLPVGILTLVFGILLSVSRVLLGIHFPRDVIAGALIGVVSGLIGACFI